MTKAVDGTNFHKVIDRDAHNDDLFDKWCESRPMINVGDLLDALDDSDDAEFEMYNTERGFAYYLLRRYWNTIATSLYA